ncbi:MAG: hypothetical protein L0332_27130 [Chloroflexi bacterium]|nr:hypothetical protein [Chloroflexota bacterium]MCI0577134.1 hypothetical protein [Chloroflexota bacterium]MCI0644674.1 hypothetical protein [Chloroflexota bacterium]MCI0730372.1 hypothetical protein [Chloroflexota bacterium]
MSDEEVPSVEEIKSRLGDEIPVEEEPTEASKANKGESEVAAELRNLGRQFAETLRTAWNSQERQKFESEVREGVKSFADEVDKVIRELRESPAAQKAKEEATTLKTKVEAAEVGQKARTGLVQGLNWLSEELGKLANQFTPPEKEPPAED